MSAPLNKSAAINKIRQQQAAAQQQGKTNTAPAGRSDSAPASLPFALTPRAGRSRWSVDLASDRRMITSSSSSSSSSSDLIPLGFTSRSDYSSTSLDTNEEKSRAAADDTKQQELLSKSAMALATAPGKQLMMTAFMLWMSGNSLQIFSIMMLGMALWTPISEIFNVQMKFVRYADSGIDLILPKLTFIAMNLAGLGVALYKCNSMGLLPTASADWIDTGVRAAVQVSAGGFV